MKLNKLYKNIVKHLDGTMHSIAVSNQVEATIWFKKYVELEEKYRQAMLDLQDFSKQCKLLREENERIKGFTNIKILLKDIITELRELDK